ncbi:hypothetical protein QEZ52_00310 [Aliisedimentitalea scapharcae]|uniref:Uncharacterized protein n=1 Tax=Aliisedimentitalea scapharcae TaxID=1524259 RepID=A0ABZ2XSF1_9RHOB
MSAGSEIASEIAAALAEAGEAVGNGPLLCTLRKPGSGGPTSPHDATPEPNPTLHELTAIEDNKHLRDRSGALIGKTLRTLTVNATGAVPQKGEEIAVGVASVDVTVDTRFDLIMEVRPVSPGGVAVMYELDLET